MAKLAWPLIAALLAALLAVLVAALSAFHIAVPLLFSYARLYFKNLRCNYLTNSLI